MKHYRLEVSLSSNHFRRVATAALASLVCIAAVATPAGAAGPDYGDQLLEQQRRVFKPVRNSKVPVKPRRAWLKSRKGKPFGNAKVKRRRSGGVSAAASNTPQWIDGTIAYQSGTNCSILGQPYTELQVGAFTGYWGTQDISYPKIGDRYWGHVYMTAVGNTCPYGIADVATDIALPQGTQLAVNPNSSDPNDKIRCYVTGLNGQTGEATDQNWVAPWDKSITGKYCSSTSVSNGFNGIYLGQRLLAQGQSFHIVFPLKSTRKLSGIAEPQDAARMTSTLTSGVNTTASPYQWVFVGDRPVEASCPALGQDAASAITNTTAHTRNFLCNWYRTGKVQIEIGEGTSGPYQAMSPQYDVDGQYQGYYFDQDWAGLKPGTDYHWRLRFTDTKGTTTTADDQLYLGQPSTFKTTGSPPAPGTGGAPTPGTGGAGDGTIGGPPPPPVTGGQQSQQPQQTHQPEQPQETRDEPPSAPRDTQAPGLTAAVGKLKLRDLLRKGFRATATCTESCTVQAQLQLDKKTARKLKLGKKVAVIGKGRVVAPRGGKVTVPVKLTKKAKKALKRARSLKATLVVIATDTAGNSSRPVKKKLKLKR